MNVRELAAGADDGVAVVPQLPGHADQGGGAAADGKQGRPPPPVQAVAGGQPDQQGGLPVQAGDGSAAAGDQTTVSNSQQGGVSGMSGLGKRQESERYILGMSMLPLLIRYLPHLHQLWKVGSG